MEVQRCERRSSQCCACRWYRQPAPRRSCRRRRSKPERGVTDHLATLDTSEVWENGSRGTAFVRIGWPAGDYTVHIMWEGVLVRRRRTCARSTVRSTTSNGKSIRWNCSQPWRSSVCEASKRARLRFVHADTACMDYWEDCVHTVVLHVRWRGVGPVTTTDYRDPITGVVICPLPASRQGEGRTAPSTARGSRVATSTWERVSCSDPTSARRDPRVIRSWIGRTLNPPLDMLDANARHRRLLRAPADLAGLRRRTARAPGWGIDGKRTRRTPVQRGGSKSGSKQAAHAG